MLEDDQRREVIFAKLDRKIAERYVNTGCEKRSDVADKGTALVESVSVDSSRIDSVCYQKTTRIMTVRLKNGMDYSYPDTSYDIFLDFIKVESPGRFYNKWVSGGY